MFRCRAVRLPAIVFFTVSSSAFAQVVTTVAGGGWRPFLSQSSAIGAPLGAVRNPALDGQGNVYVADSYNHIVVRISPNGTLNLVAGNGNGGFSGDGGPAALASLNFPTGVAVDAAGNLYIADHYNNRIRKVSSGTISTVAGNGTAGFNGDGPAINAELNNPVAVAVDGAGNLYISDQFNERIREVSGGVMTTVAGNGFGNFSGDGGPAVGASLWNPHGIALDAAGNLYIADSTNNRIRKVSGGKISTIAGNGTAGYSGDGASATGASLNEPEGVAVDSNGQVFIADFFNGRIRKVAGATITTVAGNGTFGFSGDGGPAATATFAGPEGVVVDSNGQLFINDFFNERVRKVSASGTVTTVAGGVPGTLFGDGGPATSAALLNTVDVAVDSSGNLYIADQGNNCIRKVSAGILTTVAGNCVAGFAGDGGPAASASLNMPSGVALDGKGNLYIADTFNNRVRKVSGGVISTVAGNGAAGFSGEGGSATGASLNMPSGVALDAAGNLYIADFGNNRVRKVSASGGTITTVAGTGVAGVSGEGGPATGAALNGPEGVALDATGNLYIADYYNNRVLKVSSLTATIAAVAGTGASGFSGDGGPALNATLDQPTGVAVDTSGNLFIADHYNNRIRKVSGGMIATIAGNGSAQFSGDGGPAASAGLSNPTSVTVDGTGNLFIADTYDYRVREVLQARPSYQVSPASLTFSANSGGSVPATQTIGLLSAVSNLGFTTSVSDTWLSVTPSNGSIPISLLVSVDPTNLAAGTYQGTITVSTPYATPPSTTVAVTFNVQSATPAQLSAGAPSLSFTAIQGGAAESVPLQISNTGSGSLSFSAAPSTTTGGGWLTVSAASGTATPASPAYLTVTANPGSLAPGTYSGSLSLTSGGTVTPVAVTLSISSPNAAILLSQSGLTFTAVEQGGAPLTQTFAIINTGQGSMTWSATAKPLSGGNWLTISPATGTVTQPYVDVSTVTVSINPMGLSAGDYYGQVQVTSSAVNSPQLLTVILTVLPAGSTPGPDVQPATLFFTGAAGLSPGFQDVLIGNPEAQPNSYVSASVGKGFTYLPTSGTVAPNQPVTLRVFSDFSQLQPGEVAQGTITLRFSDGTTRNVGVLTVVGPSTVTSDARVGPDAATCPNTVLNIQIQSPLQNFTAVLGKPTNLQLQVTDACGNKIDINPANPKGASVTATFTNKDNLVTLNDTGNGIWTGTWTPKNPTPVQETIIVSAFNNVGNENQGQQAMVSGTLSATGAVTPAVTSGGVVHAASDAAGVPIAPGSLITLYGSNLADATGQSSSLPLPDQQNGAQVLLGNLPLPILYTSNGQINVQVPFDTPVNWTYQISVQRDSLLSVPQQLVIAAGQPGVFTVNEQGTGQGVIFRSDGVTLAEPDTPAAVGETVVIYCTGLGAVNPPVSDGAPGPASPPLSTTANPVTVMINGLNAPVSFSGLAPGFPGLYQVNAVVPVGASGSTVPVTVSVAGQTSPQVTMAVQ